MASFSDSFPVDGEPGAGWSEVDGDCDVVSGVLLCRSGGFELDLCVRTGSILAADQYVRVNIVRQVIAASFPVIVFRYSDASSPFYGLVSDGINGDSWTLNRYANLADLSGGGQDWQLRRRSGEPLRDANRRQRPHSCPRRTTRS